MPDTPRPDVVQLEPMSQGMRAHTIRVTRYQSPSPLDYFRAEPHTELVHRPRTRAAEPEDIDGFYQLETRSVEELGPLLPHIPAEYLRPGTDEYAGEMITSLVHLEFLASHDELGQALWPNPHLGTARIEVWVAAADRFERELTRAMCAPLPAGADIGCECECCVDHTQPCENWAGHHAPTGFDHHVVYTVWPLQVSLLRMEGQRRVRFLGVARHPDGDSEPWLWRLDKSLPPPLFEVLRTEDAPPAPSTMRGGS